MTRFRRALLAAALLSLVAFIPVGPAEADYMGIKVEVGGPATFVYIGGDPDARTGSAAVCVAGEGVTVNFAPQAPTQGCPATVPAGTEIVTIPPSGGGGEPPPFPCSDQATCQALVEELIGGGGGGEEPPSGGEAPSAPAQRDCTGATGGEATCVDFGDGNFILGDPPDDGHGELGVCAGGSYFFVAGPEPPDGDGGAPCPAAAAAPAGGEPTPTPSDSDGDGLADGSDRCPDSAAGTSDGCPPQNPSGTSTSSTESSTTTGQSQTTQERPAAPAEPDESPLLDITRNRLRVSRRGWVGIPLACRTRRTPCIGSLRLTATRRKEGRRVRVVLARARVHVDAGDTMKRRVRITRRGRELLARRSPLRTRARIRLSDDAATVARAERLTLRRVRR